ELALIEIFRAHRIIGWRRHLPLPGRPDFVFPKQRLVLFVDGCFWHGCPKHSRHVSKSGTFWMQKIQNNRTRDRRVKRQLSAGGWRVLRVWEHELARKRRLRLIARLEKFLFTGVHLVGMY